MLRSFVRRSSFAAALVGLACGRPAEADVAGAAPVAETKADPAPLHVEFAGCAGGERASNTCVLNDEAALTLWVAGAVRPRITAAGREVVPLRAEEVDDGWRCHVVVPKGADTLAVDREGSATWSLSLMPALPEPVLGTIIAKLPDQNAAGRGPKLEAALVDIEAKLASMSPTERVSALRLATVLTWDLGRDGAEYGRRALAAAIDSNDAARVLDTSNILQYMLDEGSAESSRALDLETLYAANVEDGIRLARWELDAAYHALHIGETGKGIRYLRAAEARARRLGLRDEELSALAKLSVVLATHGREVERAEAIARFLAKAQHSTEASACSDAANLANAAASFAYAKLTGASALDPEPILRLAIAKFETDPVRCKAEDNPDWHDAHALARVNYVLVAVVDERWDEVEQRLAWFDDRKLLGNRRNSVLLSRSQLALHRGDIADARRQLDAVREPQELVEWRHQVVLGRLEQRVKNDEAALLAYLAAEKVVDELSRGPGLETSRQGAALGIHAGAAHAIALLASAGRDVEAAEIARVSRARALRPVGVAARVASLTAEQRAQWLAAMADYDASRDRIATELTTAWSLPTDERDEMLRAHKPLRSKMQAAQERAFEILAKATETRNTLGRPAKGEAWLLFHPSATGWFGIALRDGSVTIRDVRLEAGTPSAAAMGRALLDPFDEELAVARSVKVLAMGELLDVAFHELPWRGKPLVEHLPVSWAVDVLAPPLTSAPEAGGHALIVADPATFAAGVGRLPHAAEEADVVRAALLGRGWAVDVLAAERATLPGVLDVLGEARWLHYAGHGLAETASAWDAALPLAGEAQLTVRDILTGTSVPRTVVLSGCNTAATRAGGLSLATAFVLAGSRAVIGSTTELADADAREMSEALYRHAGASDDAAWVRAALLEGRASGARWTSSLRLWSP